MQLGQSLALRTDQRQILTPRMIQSMEILQMPLTQLEERIEQELASNPVLELREPEPDDRPTDEPPPREPVTPLTTDGQRITEADFERLRRIADYLENEEWSPSYAPRSRVADDGERDGKLDALSNTADRSGNLAEHLLRQWAFVTPPADAPPDVKQHFDRAGRLIIDHLDADGYLRTPLETVRTSVPDPPPKAAMDAALEAVQTLDPPGVGARDLIECFLLQLDALEADPELAEGHDFPLERALITRHLDDLRNNRYPQLAKKLGRSIDQIKAAVRRLSRLHAHPGHQVAPDDAPPITPDAVIYRNPDTGEYEVEMTRNPADQLTLSPLYRKLLKDKSADKSAREFLNSNYRNARWLLDAIEQRRNTLQRVIRQVVLAQKDFFDKGPEYLKPLPMVDVANRLGIHVATVSRAVADKYVQTPQGIFPLRRFFTGGTTSADGEDMAWDAVREKIRTLIAEEDKSDPLSDEQIVEKLAEQGITLARRTVAKYRGLLGIPTARQRRQY